jgi:hypothetical protein
LNWKKKIIDDFKKRSNPNHGNFPKVQRNLGVDTKKDFFDFFANGNVRTPYIPKEPEKYYSDNGTWISWDHFLKD